MNALCKAVDDLHSLHADMIYSPRSPGMWRASKRILEIAAELEAEIAAELEAEIAAERGGKAAA